MSIVHELSLTKKLGSSVAALLGAVMLLSATGAVHAQPPGAGGPPPGGAPGGGPGGPPPSARAQAPFDLSGYWVSLVTRDWRMRMIVPGRGEYRGIPLTLASKQFADAWDPARDEAAGLQCEAYGAGVVMLIPERLHITWTDDETLQVQTDAGMQTRVLHFTPAAPGDKSWQGYSKAAWNIKAVRGPPPGGGAGRGGGFGLAAAGAPLNGPPAAGGAPPAPWGYLTIATNNMLPGLVRKNGLPYSGAATLLEYWQLMADPAEPSTSYLIDTAALSDPTYLQRPYYYTTTFRKESDGSKWDPTPCTLRAAP
jgi:hypothetical protein